MGGGGSGGGRGPSTEVAVSMTTEQRRLGSFQRGPIAGRRTKSVRTSGRRGLAAKEPYGTTLACPLSTQASKEAIRSSERARPLGRPSISRRRRALVLASETQRMP